MTIHTAVTVIDFTMWYPKIVCVCFPLADYLYVLVFKKFEGQLFVYRICSNISFYFFPGSRDPELAKNTNFVYIVHCINLWFISLLCGLVDVFKCHTLVVAAPKYGAYKHQLKHTTTQYYKEINHKYSDEMNTPILV